MGPIGNKTWAIAGGRIPFGSTGVEPEFTSRDVLAVLNTSDTRAHLEITIYYADREPIGPYEVTVDARRVRHCRFNDLIDPQAIPLDTDYGAVIESNVPVVVHFLRQDTRQAANAIFGMIAYADS